MSDRVDKAWQKSGISTYSTEAILGTLNHYGATTSEAAYKAAAKERYPIAIAQGWLSTWKGTGQFSMFPAAAAVELWRRLETDRLAPAELAGALAELLAALTRLLEGAADAPVGVGFKAVDALRPRVPVKGGKVDQAFVEETLTILGREILEVMDQMAEKLSSDGHQEDAEQFADIEEFLLPDRQGISKAIVKARAGDLPGALALLEGIAGDAQRDWTGRLTAVDGLIHLEAPDKAAGYAEKLLDEGESKKDYHQALAAGARLVHVLERTHQRPKARALKERLEKIQAEHDQHHHH